MASQDHREDQLAHPEVFRDPTPAEHRFAARLFIGFGVGFVLLFVVLSGWWFRWVMLGLGAYSILDGVRHWMAARRP
jgi:hypothetical protein